MTPPTAAPPGVTVPPGTLISPAGAPGAPGGASGTTTPPMLTPLLSTALIPIGATGPFCSIQTTPVGTVSACTPNTMTAVASRLKETLMTAYGNAGLTGVTLQPQILYGDGVWRDFGPQLIGNGIGWLGSITILATHYGAQWNVVSAPVGATVNAEIDSVQETP